MVAKKTPVAAARGSQPDVAVRKEKGPKKTAKQGKRTASKDATGKDEEPVIDVVSPRKDGEIVNGQACVDKAGEGVTLSSKKKTKKARGQAKSTIASKQQEPLEPQSQSQTADSANSAEAAMRVVSCAAGVLTERPILFTSDSEYFLCAVGSSVRIFRVKTGDIVRSLDAPATASNVCAVHLSPRNRFQLFVFHEDGQVHLWELQDASVLKTWKLPFSNVKSVNMAGAVAQSQRFVCQETYTNDKGNHATRINSFCLAVSSEEELVETTLIAQDLSADSVLDVSCDGMKLAYTTDRRRIEVFDSEQQRNIQWFTHDRDITVLRFHPLNNQHLAMGDSRGQIFVWHLDTHLEHQRGRPQHTKLHWHAFAVQTISFSPDGTALISGGQEGVLVVWQLATGKPRFLPRMGARLVQVLQSPDCQHYLVAGDDNAIHIISAVDFNLEQSTVGLRPVDKLVQMIQRRPVLFTYQADGTVIVQAAPGSLQVWNVRMNRMLVELDVAERPRMQCSDAGAIVGATVQFAAMSKDGQWLATVDERTTVAVGGEKAKAKAQPGQLSTITERHLKFWRKVSAGQGWAFQLVTRINRPHDDRITGLVFFPRSLPGTNGSEADYVCATSSMDGTFKVWQTAPAPPEYTNTHDRPQLLAEQSQQQQQASRKKDTPIVEAPTVAESMPPTWVCRASAYWRGLPASSLDYSADGSVLAVSFGNTITLWQPFTATLYRVLAQAPSVSVKSVHWFGCKTKNRSRSRYLAAVMHDEKAAAGSKTQLAVWDVVRGEVHWKRPLRDEKSCLLHMDKSSGLLALAEVINEEVINEEVVNEKVNGAKVTTTDKNNAKATTTEPFAGSSWTLTTFEPESSTPQVEQQFQGSVYGMAIAPGDSRPKHYRPPQLICLNQDTNLVVMERAIPIEQSPDATGASSAVTSTWTDLFSTASSTSPNFLAAFVPHHANKHTTAASKRKQSVAAFPSTSMPTSKASIELQKNVQRALDTPAHVLPSLNGFYDMFMEQLLVSTAVERRQDDSDGEGADGVATKKTDADDVDMQDAAEPGMKTTMPVSVTTHASVARCNFEWMQALVL